MPPIKESQILFSGEMIRALLAGTKTQTRRVVKGAPSLVRWNPIVVAGRAGWEDEHGRPIICSYGEPGDRLWVRETCRAEELESGQDGVRYLADDHFRPIDNTTSDAISWMRMHAYGKQGGTNVPSIHMPRWACRLLLEITDVRVEQLQDISESDVIAEGCPNEILYGRGWYRDLWEQLKGADSWDANPWVWVIEFKKIEAQP